jgi:hypothetical protein
MPMQRGSSPSCRPVATNGIAMPSFSTTRRVAFTPQQMFDLVADVEKYPLFLPLCEKLLVRKREQAGDKQVLIADMTSAITRYARPSPAASRSIRSARRACGQCAGDPSDPSGVSRTDGARPPAAAKSDPHLYDFSWDAAGAGRRPLRPRVPPLHQAFEARARAVYGPRRPPRRQASPVRVELLAQQGERHLTAFRRMVSRPIFPKRSRCRVAVFCATAGARGPRVTAVPPS